MHSKTRGSVRVEDGQRRLHVTGAANRRSRKAWAALGTASPEGRCIQASAEDSLKLGGLGGLTGARRSRRGSYRAQAPGVRPAAGMDDEEETYRLWKIRKTIMQVSPRGAPCLARAAKAGLSGPVVSPRDSGVSLPGMFAVSS